MEILDPDTFLQLFGRERFCSVPGHIPYNHPINKYKRSEMTEAALCNVLGIKQNVLLRYLFEHGVLF